MHIFIYIHVVKICDLRTYNPNFSGWDISEILTEAQFCFFSTLESKWFLERQASTPLKFFIKFGVILSKVTQREKFWSASETFFHSSYRDCDTRHPGPHNMNKRCQV